MGSNVKGVDIITSRDGRKSAIRARLAAQQGFRAPVIVLTEGRDTHEDDCIINPPPAQQILKALGIDAHEALLILACRSAAHFDAYCTEAMSTDYASVLSTDRRHKVLFEVRLDSDGREPTTIGSIGVGMTEFLLGEPLGGFTQALDAPAPIVEAFTSRTLHPESVF